MRRYSFIIFPETISFFLMHGLDPIIMMVTSNIDEKLVIL